MEGMKGRVLVVDDDADSRAALAEALREGGYSVETAADAFKGLGKVPEFAPDLVLTDLRMVPIDGLELLIVEIDGIVFADPRTLEAILSESQFATQQAVA